MKTLTYAIRFLSRSKAYTIINLLGLAFSLACCIILMRYIHRELTVDTHCMDREQVYAIKISMEGSESIGSITSYEYDPVKLDKSQIEIETRYTPLDQDFLIANGHRFPSRTIVTDSAFFKLFHYPLLQGKLTLDKPTSVLLKKDFAHKLFGNDNPIGKTIRHSNGKDLIVEGIIDEPTCKTSIQFDMVLSYHLSTRWERMEIDLYRFLPGTDMSAMAEIGNTPRYLNNPQWDTRQFTFSFVPLKETYWHEEWHDQKTMFFSGQKSHLYILAGVCLLLFLTGLLNFINLYLVAMLRRGKEYGLKKVYGASKSTLFLQIWLENFLLTLSALLVAGLIIEVTQIPVNRLLNTQFVYTPFDGWLALGILLFLPLVTSIYPFLKYSFSSPIRSIQSIGWGSRSVRSRMVFLGIQYALTFLITVCALYYNGQLSLLLNTDPGFRTKNIILAKLIYSSQDFNSFSEEKYQQERTRNQAIGDKLKACPFIEYTESAWDKITEEAYEVNHITPEGKTVLLSRRMASPTFFKMFGISLFDIRQRYREIAIRKAHGASMKDLYQLLFKKYLAVLGASFVVAVPIAYYLIHQYTADFVVKAPIGMGIFVLALLLVAVISMGTLYWQIHKAANIDPATVMKTE